jgi:hypothetical protein
MNELRPLEQHRRTAAAIGSKTPNGANGLDV